MANRRKRKKIMLIVLAILIAIPVLWFGVRRIVTDYIPPADRSDIGETITLSFPELLTANPYEGDFSPEGNDHMSFVYVYESQTGKGKLTVFTRVPGDPSLCCVTVYEPEWVGGEGLCQNLTGSFRAKVVECKNITSKEGFFLVHNITRFYEEVDAPETFLDIAEYQDTGGPYLQWFLGVMDCTPQSTKWHMLDESISVAVKAGTVEASPESFSGDVDALCNILDRYKLYKKVIPDGRK